MCTYRQVLRNNIIRLGSLYYHTKLTSEFKANSPNYLLCPDHCLYAQTCNCIILEDENNNEKQILLFDPRQKLQKVTLNHEQDATQGHF